MKDIFHKLLKAVGEDPCRAGLKGTPERAARAYKFLTKGYKEDLEKVINGAIFDSDNDEMIIVKDIEMSIIFYRFSGSVMLGIFLGGRLSGFRRSRGLWIFLHVVCRFRRTLPNKSRIPSCYILMPGVSALLLRRSICA